MKRLRLLIPLTLIPLVVLVGSQLSGGRRHLLVSLAVAILSLWLFALGYERRQTGSRRMVLASVMIALSVVGRLIPVFKPVTAITVLAAVYLGGETGFLVGAMSALLSNFLFGQGPWTPFQMLAWGLIGLLAAAMAQRLRRGRLPISLYGLLSGVIFSMVMDVWTVLWMEADPGLSHYTAALVAALPHTLLYAVSNFFFLWFLSKPFGEKLERIRIKYGL